MSIFDQMPLLPDDPILGLVEKFKQDSRPEKVDLSVGVYRNEKLETIKFGSVLDAEKKILENEVTKNYLPIQGMAPYLQKSKELVFGKELTDEIGGRIFAAQTVGATAALRISCEIISKYINKNIFVSNPTWPNHIKIAKATGLNVSSYPYYNGKEHKVDFDGFYTFLEQALEKSVILIQPSCHNPTGCDLTQNQWRQLLPIFQKKNLIPFFDMAYQGLGHGFDEDAFPIRLFAKEGQEFFLATSYSKNFGLYGERVGCLFIITKDREQYRNISSVVKSTIREMYSNPPIHGAAIVSEILTDPSLREKWLAEVSAVRKRIQNIREKFAALLIKETGNDELVFLKDRFGLFSYSGLAKEQVDRLMKEFAIYMTSSGRINITGLNDKNMPYVVEAITKVSR